MIVSEPVPFNSPRPFRWIRRASLLALVTAGFARGAADPPADLKPAAGLPVAELRHDSAVDFEREILPFLKNNCLACHNATKAKASLNLETPEHIRKGGDTGPGVVPGKPAESLVFKAAAHLDPDVIMPPRDNKANATDLKPDQLALLKLWIEQGATGEVHAAAPVKWLESPPALDPIFAVALTSDGQFAACSRGNRIDVYHVPSRQRVAQLGDDQLGRGTNAAHRDQVNALAFNPDGTLLASGAYREAKLWRRRPPEPARTWPYPNTRFAVSPDGKWLAGVETNHTVVLREAASGKEAHRFEGHSNTVTSLAFSPDGRHLATVSRDRTLRIWNVKDGDGLAAEGGTELHAVTWLGAGSRLAAGGADGVIQIWTNATATPGLAAQLGSSTNAIAALENTGDGTNLFCGRADGVVQHWNVPEEKKVREFTAGAPLAALRVGAGGRRVTTAGATGPAKLWNATNGELVAELKGDRYAIELVAETDRSLSVARSDVEYRKKSLETTTAEHKKQTDRVTRATETNGITEKIFAEKNKALQEARTAKTEAEKALTDLLAEIQKTSGAFEGADQSAKDAAARAKAAATKAIDARLASERGLEARADAEKTATDTEALAARTKASIVGDLPPEAKAAAARVAEDAAAVAQKTRSFAVAVAADADGKTKLAAEARMTAEKAVEEVAALAFAAGQLKPAYDRIVAEAPEKRKQATNIIERTSKTLATSEQEFKRAETRKAVTVHELELATQSAQRASNALSAAQTVLASTETAQKEIEARLEQRKKSAVATEQPFRALAFAPDGVTLATLDRAGKVQTWSAETGVAFDVLPQRPGGVPSSAGGKEEPDEPGETDRTPSLNFVDSDSLLVSSPAQGGVVWQIHPPWTIERRLGTGDIDSPMADRVNALDFTPDGTTLVTGSGEPTRSGEIQLWNVADGKLLREFENVHSDAVLSLRVSPDGKYLASASADRFARVVELATGKVVKSFEGHTSYVLGVAWKRDTRTLVSAGADNMMKVWDVVTGERKKNIEGAGKEVTSLAFVGATDQAVAASGDGVVRLVRENGELVRTFAGATDFIHSVAATPDGALVIAGGQDSVLRLWNGKTGDVAAALK